MIDLATTNDPAVLHLLRQHPKVTAVETGDAPLRFQQGEWAREVAVGISECEVRGVPELMDNNPMVCADSVAVPSAGATLAVLALGQLVRAGILVEGPALLANMEVSAEELGYFLGPMGVTTQVEEVELRSAVAVTAICAIATPDRLEDLDDLYAEAYGRSAFVGNGDDAAWDVSRIVGTPYALYRLRIAPDQPQSLLTVQVMADRDGKCGAAQIVHAMNIMAGLEETLGIA